jgi:hypothetical protein
VFQAKNIGTFIPQELHSIRALTTAKYVYLLQPPTPTHKQTQQIEASGIERKQRQKKNE